MNAIDLKRAEFRQYLESNGVMEVLSYALIKLYDESVKPKDPVAFVRDNFKRPNDQNIDSIINIEASEALQLFKKQQNELELARQEISKLRHTLNAMADHSPAIESLERVLGSDSISYRSIFDDSAYETTLVKKYLTENMFKSFTEYDSKPTIVDCIVKADALDSHPLGIIALNGDCYTKFSELFEPIIQEINGLDNSIEKHPDSDWGDENQFEPLNSDRIISIEFSCSRSLTGFNFISGMNEQDLQNVLSTVQNAIQSNHSGDEEIDGEFYKITDVKETEPIFDDLQTFELGFQSMNPKDHRLWPIGRGLYINCARTQSILINEFEHLRFVCAELGGDFGSVYRNLKLLVEKFGEGLKFERNDKFGWLTTNLNRLGTTLSGHIKFRLGNKPIECLKNICQKYKIGIRLIDDLDGAQVVELSSQASFGLTEIEYAKTVYGHFKEVLDVLESGNEESIENDCDGDTVNDTNPDKELDPNENETNQNAQSDENKVEKKSKEKDDASPNEIEDVEQPMTEKSIGQDEEIEEIHPYDPNESNENENIECPEITNEAESKEKN